MIQSSKKFCLSFKIEKCTVFNEFKVEKCTLLFLVLVMTISLKEKNKILRHPSIYEFQFILIQLE
jgi:hypothetical protein